MRGFVRFLSRFVVVSALSIALIGSTGCLNGKSVEEYGFVLAIGIDRGEQLKYKVTYLMQSSVESGESARAGELILISGEGENMLGCLRVAESGAPYEFDFARMNFIAVSKDIAEEGLLEDFFSFSLNELKLRSSASMVVTTESAGDFFEGLRYAEELNYSKLVFSLIDYRGSIGLTSSLSLAQFLGLANSSRGDSVIPLGSVDNSIISAEQAGGSGGQGQSQGQGQGQGQGQSQSQSQGQSQGQGQNQDKDEQSADSNKDTTSGQERTGGLKSYVMGAALFDGFKMVGVISPEENQLKTLCDGKLERASFIFSREDGMSSTIRIENSKGTDVDITLGDRPKVVFNIVASARLEQESDLLTIHKETLDKDMIHDIEDGIETYLEQSLSELFYNCRELNCDIFRIGQHAALKFSSTADWEAYDFQSRLNEFEAEFNVELDLEDIFVAMYQE